MTERTFIAVIGGGQCSDEEYRLARAVGEELAVRGAVVICGGLGGVMEAVCRGARDKGGLTIGILPRDSRRDANPYVEVPIVTGMGSARNLAVVKSAQAVIAIGGQYGTLSEIAHARQAGLPVIGLKTWTVCKDGVRDDSIVVADSPRDAVAKALTRAVEP